MVTLLDSDFVRAKEAISRVLRHCHARRYSRVSPPTNAVVTPRPM